MNEVALAQNFLFKTLVFGATPKGEDEETPMTAPYGLKVYLNGKHKMPDHDEIETRYAIGKFIHPYAMSGMPDCSGKVEYELAETCDAYICLIWLKLDEHMMGESEPAVDILALIKKDSIPEDTIDHEEKIRIAAQDMILCHFERLFEFIESYEEIKDWEFEEDFIHQLVKHHFELRKQ